VLQGLAIQGCWKLGSLPEDFGQLQNLHFLALENLDSLRELPDSVGDLVMSQGDAPARVSGPENSPGHAQ